MQWRNHVFEFRCRARWDCGRLICRNAAPFGKTLNVHDDGHISWLEARHPVKLRIAVLKPKVNLHALWHKASDLPHDYITSKPEIPMNTWVISRVRDRGHYSEFNSRNLFEPCMKIPSNVQRRYLPSWGEIPDEMIHQRFRARELIRPPSV